MTSASAGTDCGVRTLAGTSMSAPLAAGAAALVRQYFIDGWYPHGERTPDRGFVPSGALIKAMLIQSAVKMSAVYKQNEEEVPITQYPSNTQGFGRISIGNVLNFGPSEDEYISLLVRGSADRSSEYFVEMTEEGEVHEYLVRTNPDAPAHDLRVCLVYTDAIGALYRQPIVVNLLSLMLLDLSTGDYHPPLYPVGSVRDTVSMIEVPNAKPNASFRISVIATDLNVDQSYAIVITSAVTPTNKFKSKDNSFSLFFHISVQILVLVFVGLALMLVSLFHIHAAEWKAWYHQQFREGRGDQVSQQRNGIIISSDDSISSLDILRAPPPLPPKVLSDLDFNSSI